MYGWSKSQISSDIPSKIKQSQVRLIIKIIGDVGMIVHKTAINQMTVEIKRLQIHLQSLIIKQIPY